MTIAAGILCADGIVICSDSQETYGDFKWPVKKLVFPRTSLGDFSILIAGAGFASAIDAAAQKIFDRTAMLAPTYEQTLRIIQDVLREVHEKDLANYPTNDKGSLQFRLLIAFSSGGNGGLFITDGSLLTRVDSYAILGAPEVTRFFAEMLYRKTIFENPDIGCAEGAVLATFLVHLAKAQMVTIGGKPQLAMITAEGIRFANVWESPALEQIFERCLKIGAELVLECANPHFSEKDFAASLKEHALVLRKMKRAIVKKRKDWDKLWQDYKEVGGMLLGHSPMQSDAQMSVDQP